ncbi:MAG TPA: Ig-like domain-containing protein [Phycisphaerales bacterium]|nr:Ig-like domain-containing protein [Phycisphaerales bacterium]
MRRKSVSGAVVAAGLAVAVLPAAARAQLDPIVWDQRLDYYNIQSPWAISSDFGPGSALTAEAADDFCLHARVSRVTVSGLKDTNAWTGVRVRFYGQGPGGVPGALQYERQFQRGTSAVVELGTDTAINLDVPFEANGRHLMTVQFIGTRFDWYADGNAAVSGQSYYWRNPGGGWNQGNADWAPIEPKDLAFVLRGVAHAGAPDCTIPPAAGPQTITWRAADNPHVVNGTLTVGPNTTLVIEPGVQVQINAASRIVVEGRIEGEGTAAAPIVFAGANNHNAEIATRGGHVDLGHARVNCKVISMAADPARRVGTINFRDTQFAGPYAYVTGGWEYCGFERCSFEMEYGPWLNGAVRLVDVTSDETITLVNGIYVLHNVVVTGADGESMLDGAGLYWSPGIQDAYLTGLTATGNALAGVYLANGNTLIGPGNTITGNLYAVELGAGLLPGSTIPASGNTHNGFVSVGYGTGLRAVTAGTSRDLKWGDVGVPYVTTGFNPGLGGRLTILPGVDVRLTGGAIMDTSDAGAFSVMGTPSAPVTFTRHDAGAAWSALAFATAGNRVRSAVVEGSERGLVTYGGAIVDVIDSTVRGNGFGGQRGVRAWKSQFLQNGVGVSNTGSSFASSRPDFDQGPQNPNAVVGNAVGVQDALACNGGAIDGENVWWGSPTGPNSWDNPGGTGDTTQGCVDAVPFASVAPDFADHPPVVRILNPGLYEPGRRVMITWEATDDGAISHYRVAYQPRSNTPEGFITIQDQVPAGQRAIEWTVPDVGPLGAGGGAPHTYLRVVAVDQRGQEGYDERQMVIPDGGLAGELTLSAPFVGQTLDAGERVDLTWAVAQAFDPFFSGQVNVYLVLENDDHWHYLSAGTLAGPTGFSNLDMPCVSTDSARLVVEAWGTYNVLKHFFTEPFAIRPDTRLGDAPPAVTMTGPAAGAAFPAGGVVPITWTASDDLGVREIKLFASYDQGRTWNLIADGLAGTSTSYAWRTAPGEGFGDVRVKVVAVDTRFQNSSDGRGRAIAITPGSGPPPCPADFNGSGTVTTGDITAFLNAWFTDLAGGTTVADFNGSGATTTADITAFLGAWFQGVQSGC